MGEKIEKGEAKPIGMPWKNQRELQEATQRLGLPSEELLSSMILEIPNPRHRACIALLLLTTGRVSEVIAIKKENIKTKWMGNRDVLIVNMPNRKHRKRKWKQILIPQDMPNTQKLIHEIDIYITGLLSEDRLFNVTKIAVWQWCMKYLEVNPHFLRHTGLTHCVTEHNFNSGALMRRAGWTSLYPATAYMELRVEDELRFYPLPTEEKKPIYNTEDEDFSKTKVDWGTIRKKKKIEISNISQEDVDNLFEEVKPLLENKQMEENKDGTTDGI